MIEELAAVVKKLTHESVGIRRDAARTLIYSHERVDFGDFLPKLINIFENEPDPFVRERIVEAVRLASEWNTHIKKQAAELFRKGLNDTFIVRSRCLEALGIKVNSVEIIKDLMDTTEKNEEDRVRRALSAIERIEDLIEARILLDPTIITALKIISGEIDKERGIHPKHGIVLTADRNKVVREEAAQVFRLCLRYRKLKKDKFRVKPPKNTSRPFVDIRAALTVRKAVVTN